MADCLNRHVQTREKSETPQAKKNPVHHVCVWIKEGWREPRNYCSRHVNRSNSKYESLSKTSKNHPKYWNINYDDENVEQKLNEVGPRNRLI
jgi:hypothetical protein